MVINGKFMRGGNMSKLTKREIVLCILLSSVISLTVFQNYKAKQSDKLIIKNEETKAEEVTIDSESQNFNEDEFISEDSVEKEPEDPKEVIVDICGAVVNPGVVKLFEGDRIIDAVNKVGGLTEKADLKRINLARKLQDGEKIIVPEVGEETIETDLFKKNNNIEHENIKHNGKININNADKTQLMELNGIGEVLAERIIKYRNDNNGFKNIEDIKNVSGIGVKKFESIKNYIDVR